MRSSFVVCPSCSRHVRVGERSCPFCAKLVPAGLMPTPHGARRRYVGKNATALAIAALAVAGCGSEDTVVAQPNDVGAETSQSDSGSSDTNVDTRVEDTFAADVQDEGGSFPIYK